jgi:putative flippase GtrA
MKLTTLYSIFALIATAANLSSQWLCVRVYEGDFHIVISMIVGTAIGLIIKYILDKRYIFQYQTDNLAHDTRTFIVYTAMGIITTVIFWGFELGFDHLFQNEGMRLLGGGIGLAIGYISKYYLDKRFVFVSNTANSAVG